MGLKEFREQLVAKLGKARRSYKDASEGWKEFDKGKIIALDCQLLAFDREVPESSEPDELMIPCDPACVPEGYRAVRFGLRKPPEPYMSNCNRENTPMALSEPRFAGFTLILEKIEPEKPPERWYALNKTFNYIAIIGSIDREGVEAYVEEENSRGFKWEAMTQSGMREYIANLKRAAETLGRCFD